MLRWFEQNGKDGDVVISSRVRLARNLSKYNFSLKLGIAQSRQMTDEAVEAVRNVIDMNQFMDYDFKNLDESQKTAMKERHLISDYLSGQEVAAGFASYNENISIIKELVNKVKTVNIISNNKNYTKLENELEKEGIYITVNNNPRKSLKRAILVINMDFKNIANYNYNRTMTIIDLTGNLKLSKGFEGIYIKSVKVRNR